MSVRDLTTKMWYAQMIRIVVSVDDLFSDIESRTLFHDYNYRLLSEENKKYLDYFVKSFGVVDDEIFIVIYK